MDYHRILCGTGEPLLVYDDIVRCLMDISLFPDLIEPVYRKFLLLSEEDQIRLRFGLLRLQMYADINHYRDLDLAQQIKYVADLLDETLFGEILVLRREPSPETA